MRNIEHYLLLVDSYFIQKKVHEKWMLIILLTSLILGSFILFFIPLLQSLTQDKYREVIHLEKRIQDLKQTKIHTKTYTTLPMINKETIKKLKLKREQIETSLQKSPFVFLKPNDPLTLVHTLSLYAKEENISIENLHHKWHTQSQGFSKKMNIMLKGEGNYNNLLCFIQKIEQTQALIDIEYIRLHVTPKNSLLLLDMNLSLWGEYHDQ